MPRRPLQVAGLAGLYGRRQRLGDLGLVAGLADQLLDEFPDLALRNGAHEAVHRLAVLEGDDRRDGLDAELPGHRRMLVDVHLHQPDLAARLRDDLLQSRLQLLAGAAPGRPEIDEHGLVSRVLDHVGREALGRHVLDRRRRGGGRGRRLTGHSSRSRRRGCRHRDCSGRSFRALGIAMRGKPVSPCLSS